MQPDEAPPHTDADAPTTKRKRTDGPPWKALLHRDARGRIAATAANAATILRHTDAWRVIELEERTGRVVLAKQPPIPGDLLDPHDTYPREVIDADLVRTAAWFEREHGVSFGALTISQAIDAIARMRTRDPVREYLDGLTWDETPRVDAWLVTYFGAGDSAYTRGVGAAWLISAVARTFKPGCQADHMLVLEGPQGLGKSSALRALAGPPSWFSDGVSSIGNKDGAEGIRGPWIVELGELDALQRAELATIKAFVSRPTDRYREAYGRRTADHPRRVVFAGTTNESAYLRDPSGARRFWPVKCASIDRDGIAHDRNQLWAEAVHRFRAGEQWWPDPELARLASEQQEARHQVDAWEGPISAYVNGRAEVTVREVGCDALKIDDARLDRAAQMRIAHALQRLGWASTGNPVWRVVDGKQSRVRVYTPPRGLLGGDA